MTPESVQMLFSLALGFAVAGLCSSGYQLATSRLLSFSQLSTGPGPGTIAAIPLLVLSAPFLIMRNTILGRRAGRPPLRIRLPGHADRGLLEPDVGPGSDDDIAGLRHPGRLRRFPRHRCSWQIRPPERGAETAMPIYELDGQAPEFPGEGQYYVADTAVLIGRVRLKAEASVWFGAVLRGDNEWIELGERSQIQDNATLHSDPGFPMTIGRDCVIGHNVILHGCTIGDSSLVGMGAIMLNGARIGKNSLVGAGSVVTEGKSFPDNSLIVGAPARAIRTLDEKGVQMIRAGADIYVRRWKQYAKGLKRIG